ncbi:hypothetical protein [Neolewinella antarctica]|uniref:Uncharacterized protein n=1 Tax=Neolewinella antarctica TaxID=442734 RepID=A0ABX0XAP9_9BACT|nr:hypothetical protein [Neolewinella antarctica]NJC26029.1 hypothetical protein [Neolewinella antarctica]
MYVQKIFTGLLLVILPSISLLAQETSAQYYTDVAEKTCTCMTDKNAASMSTQQLQTQLGVCMITYVSGDMARYEKLFGAMDFTDQRKMESFGQQVGIQMMNFCPDIMMTVAGNAPPSGASVSSTKSLVSKLVATGTFVGVNKAALAEITIKQDNGPALKLTWLEYWPGSESIGELAGKQVKVGYDLRDLYDAASDDYVTRKVITNLEVL